jgi:hypothetical protein
MATRNRGPDLPIDEEDDAPGIGRGHSASKDRDTPLFNDTNDNAAESVHGGAAVSILWP